MATAKHVLGGLLAGAGQGMFAKAQRLREDALERARQAREDRQISEERSFIKERDAAQDKAAADRDEAQDRRASERDQAERDFQGGLLSTTVTDENRNVRGITRTGKSVDTGIKEHPAELRRRGGEASDDEEGMTAAEARDWNDALKANTKTDPVTGESTDWAKIEKFFRDRGNSRLADRARDFGGGGDTAAVDVEDPAYREAKGMAEEWVGDQAGLLSTDKTDFADYGGNRTAALEAKTMEFYRNRRGGQAAPPAADPASANATATGGEDSYTSPEDVRAAFKSGKLSRAEAARILREQFDFE